MAIKTDKNRRILTKVYISSRRM